mgnify:CR=1 FL=1
MPILPIDLQIFFTQMNQVGKEQAVHKEGAEIQASLHSMEMLEKAEERDNSVNQSSDIGDGLEKIKDEAHKRQEKRKKEREQREAEEEQRRRVFFSDPTLGRHIDIES